ncbi:MAG TPA: insulinase family protein [Anaerolineales bacterium]
MTVIQGFELLKEQEIPELHTKARFFRHVQTGAELLSLENEDENKSFGITFRTPPVDSTGVAHIMEHSVLCGSRKYPVKEPFVELNKGSLKTFLNAFTFPDKTCYPLASQNLQDFYNLIDVYMDAVFFPLIPRRVLEQEGWHYELDQPENPLTYKGVVFNEMKGAYSDPDSLLSRYTQQSLFPDTPYGVDSGGDPTAIPDLTYDQFKSFHDTYYHPSNARIFFYGDDDPAERLRLMDGYLKPFRAMPVDSMIPLQASFEQPRRMTILYAAGQDTDQDASAGKKAMVDVNWLLAETAPQTILDLQILGYILIGTPASPLRKALIDSGLGEDLAGVGLESELRQIYFSTGLKGIAEEDAEQVEALVLSTLEDLARDGIEADMIAAAINTTEFRLRENNTGSFPRGLSLMLRSLATWLHGGDPVGLLAFEQPLAALKRRLASGERYFESLIRQRLLENPHRTTVTLRPDPTLQDLQDAAEAERLAEVKASLSQDELLQIVENTRRLKLAQETPDSSEALATIPSLKLADLDPKIKTIPLDLSEQVGSRVLFHDLFTNGIVYLDLGFDLHTLPQELLPYVSLFGRALLEMGTATEDFVKLSQRIGLSTGGIHPASFTGVVPGEARSAAWLYLRGKSTLEQSSELLAILRDVLLTVRLDNAERFRQMVLEEKANQESALAPAGHRIVNVRLRSRFDEADWATEQMDGVTNLFFLRGLAKAIDKDWPAVLEKLETIRGILVNRSSMLSNVTLDAAAWEQFRPELDGFLSGLPSSPAQPVQWASQMPGGFEGLTIPSQVNYVGKGANLYELGYALDGSISVILNFLRTTYLWERVRVQGGAYGGFCVFDRRSGVFTYLSYRDPNLLGTLENYNQAGQFLHTLDSARLSPEELSRAIIGAIGELDAYQLPDAKGFTSMVRYLTHDSDEIRQRLRSQVLDTSLEDFHTLGEVLEQVKEAGQVVVLGSPEDIATANQAQPGFLEVKKVL